MRARPSGAPWSPAVEPASEIRATFHVTLEPEHPALAGGWLEPQASPLRITGGGGSLRLVGGVKRFAKHPERMMLELHVVDDGDDGLRDATATVRAVTGTAAYYDFTADPWATPSAAAPIRVGGVAPRGVSARIRFGFDAGSDPIDFDVELRGLSTRRTSTTSAPLAVAPDGSEAWIAFADAGIVAVVDTRSDARLAQVAVGGRPSSVAITPDGAYVLVASAECNQVAVVHRASRSIVQILGEADGVGREPRNVVVSPDGARAYVSAYVGDTITALERRSDGFAVAASVDVGRRPTGMSVSPDGTVLYVAHFLPRNPIDDNEGWVSAIDTATLAPIADAALRDDANTKEAACLAQVQAFGGYDGPALSFEACPTQLAGVFLSPSGSDGWVPGVRVAGFPIFEGSTSALGFQFLAKGANSPAMLFPLDARDPRAPAFRRVATVADITDRDEPFLACAPSTEDSEAVRASPGPTPGTLQFPGVTIPGPATRLAEGGIARFVGWTRGGRRALVLGYLDDELTVLDGATHGPTHVDGLLLSGSNPIGVAVTPDGKKGYVVYEGSTFASVLDLSAFADDAHLPEPSFVPYRLDPGAPAGQGATIITFLMLVRDVRDVPATPPVREIGTVPLVDRDPLDPLLRRGKTLFTSSSPAKYPTLSASREAACAACHPNGGNDGSVWSTMEGERRTIGLWGGTARRGWLHASATHHDATDFATAIVKERLGGTGLGDDDVRALASYVARGIPELQRPAVDPSRAGRGEAIFRARCATCHAGPDHGSGRADESSPYGTGSADGPALYDVGSATDWAHVTLGAAYTHLFPPTAKRVLDELRGDRALGAGDDVQQTLAFTPRPERRRGALRASPLVDVWENAVFFHDGRASTLLGAVVDIASRTGEPLSAEDADLLVEYLKTL
jgi:DNA-binding beta-propeller fold protein YncE